MDKFKLKGHLAMLGANTMWGLMAPVAKIVMGAAVVSPLLLTNFRMVGAAVLFWIASLFVPKEKVKGADLLRMAGAGMLGIVFNQGCYVFGVGLTSPAEATIVTTTMPVWVMLLAALFLKEPITWLKGGGIALGITGALILLAGNLTAVGGGEHLRGNLTVLAAQLSYALYLTIYKNFIKKYSVITLMKWMFTFATIAVIPVSIEEYIATGWGQMSAEEWMGVAYIVVFATFLAYMCVMTGQKHLRPTVVGMYNYVQPVVATIVSVSLGMDRITLPKLAAVALIFTGVYLVTISKARTPSHP